jgi:hypothetical protein
VKRQGWGDSVDSSIAFDALGSAAINNGGRSYEGVPAMKGIKATASLGLCLALIIAMVWPAIAGEQRSALLKQYWGTITSISIDRCGT